MQRAVVVRARELHGPIVVVVLRGGRRVDLRPRGVGAVGRGAAVEVGVGRRGAVGAVGLVEGVLERGWGNAVRSVGGVVVEAAGEGVGRVVGLVVRVGVVVMVVVHLHRGVGFLVVRRHREGSLVRVDVLALPEVLVSR